MAWLTDCVLSAGRRPTWRLACCETFWSPTLASPKRLPEPAWRAAGPSGWRSWSGRAWRSWWWLRCTVCRRFPITFTGESGQLLLNGFPVTYLYIFISSYLSIIYLSISLFRWQDIILDGSRPLPLPASEASQVKDRIQVKGLIKTWSKP